MSNIPEDKNDFLVWLNTNEGHDCIQPMDFTKPGSIRFLENRLWYAYTAGVGKQLETSSARIGELEREADSLKKRLMKEQVDDQSWEDFNKENSQP